MKLVFRMTHFDVWWGTQLSQFRNRQLLGIYALGVLVISGIGLQGQSGRGLPGVALVFLALFLALSAAVLLVVANALFSAVTLPLVRRRGVVCEHELELTDTGLVERTAANVTTTFYRDVRPLSRQAGGWLIGVGPGYFAFRDSKVVAGDPAAFAAELGRRIVAAPPAD